VTANLYQYLTTTERTALTNVATGTQVFDTTAGKKYRKTDTGWLPVIQTTLFTVKDISVLRDIPKDTPEICTLDAASATYENWPVTSLASGFITFPEQGIYKVQGTVCFKSPIDNFIFRFGIDLYDNTVTPGPIRTQSYAIADGDAFKVALPLSGGTSSKLCSGTAIISVDKAAVNSLRFWQYWFSPTVNNGVSTGQAEFPGTFSVQKIAELG
jgi:hypothetical protein